MFDVKETSPAKDLNVKEVILASGYLHNVLYARVGQHYAGVQVQYAKSAIERGTPIKNRSNQLRTRSHKQNPYVWYILSHKLSTLSEFRTYANCVKKQYISPKKQGSFSFKKLSNFTPFLDDSVRLGNRTYRVWDENRTEKWKTK